MRSELKEAIGRIHKEGYPKLFADGSKANRRNGNGKWPRWNGFLKPRRSGLSYRVKMLVFLILGGFTIYVLVAGVYYYNLISLVLVDIEKSESLVDNELKRRANLLPNLLIISAEYRAYEKRLYEHVSEMRSQLTNLKKGAPGAAGLPLSDLMSSLMAIAEEYPELKATQSFEQLMKEWTETENRVADARSKYIESVRQLNALCTTFPSNVYTGIFRVKRRELFSFREQGAQPINSVEFFSAYFGDDAELHGASPNAVGFGMPLPEQTKNPDAPTNEMNADDESQE